MNKLTAGTVAEFFISRASDNYIDKNIYEGITNLKLQKLLYFAQAIHLGVYEEELFAEEIKAWRYGPVIESIYSKYKEYGNTVIRDVDKPKLESNTDRFLESIWDMYGKYSAYELVSITHDHQPWKQVYLSGSDDDVIPKGLLINYYKGLYTSDES